MLNFWYLAELLASRLLYFVPMGLDEFFHFNHGRDARWHTIPAWKSQILGKLSCIWAVFWVRLAGVLSAAAMDLP